jgi:hypothetical protein
MFCQVVPQARFELALSDSQSEVLPLHYRHHWLERLERIELSTSAWKAVVLPLNYSRKTGAGRENRTLD